MYACTTLFNNDCVKNISQCRGELSAPCLWINILVTFNILLRLIHLYQIRLDMHRLTWISFVAENIWWRLWKVFSVRYLLAAQAYAAGNSGISFSCFKIWYLAPYRVTPYTVVITVCLITCNWTTTPAYSMIANDYKANKYEDRYGY